MRILVLIAGITLAASAAAEENPKASVKELDKSSPALSATASPDDAAGDEAGPAPARAQDYNSSRSNNSSRAAPASPADAREKRSRATSRAPVGGIDRNRENRCSVGRLDCDSDGDSIPAQATCGNGVDDDCDGRVEDRPANRDKARSGK